ncbi:MAG: STAS domain-containing protein [Planctomycetes bacterium]|nr:STAS domain-containing protein [Planctomycetota bacterium]MBM4087744.1 STAS domain-containing protein [Planctomycetota bacterium]
MEANLRKLGGAVVVDLKGEVDMHSSPNARLVLQSLVEKSSPLVVVNLENVSYIDSSGLATLIECVQRMKRYGGVFRLTGLNDHIKDVFRLARLETVFTICSSVEEAVKA